MLWDAACKTIERIAPLAEENDISGWRKHKFIRAGLKSQMRVHGNIGRKGGSNKQQRQQQAARVYLDKANALSVKANATLNELGVTNPVTVPMLLGKTDILAKAGSGTI